MIFTVYAQEFMSTTFFDTLEVLNRRRLIIGPKNMTCEYSTGLRHCSSATPLPRPDLRAGSVPRYFSVLYQLHQYTIQGIHRILDRDFPRATANFVG